MTIFDAILFILSWLLIAAAFGLLAGMVVVKAAPELRELDKAFDYLGRVLARYFMQLFFGRYKCICCHKYTIGNRQLNKAMAECTKAVYRERKNMDISDKPLDMLVAFCKSLDHEEDCFMLEEQT